jgi:anti-sigma B factor antagonist
LERGKYEDVRTGEVELDRSQNGLTVVVIRGEHDLNTASPLRTHLERLLTEGNPFVVDLTEATFIDSSILGVILQARRDAAENGVGFAVAEGGGAEAVRRVLDITGVREELPVHGTREEAASQAAGSGSPT